ncbi:hypothetical protein SAMN05660420_02664 [Desulfuromusa kysingii]|uniref:Uncharacterized protein n=1 Tax=Desulfuromusa kysingii TaxID=37625 RepID=A0A1H4CQ02_9BACT|nr:hypothetical protein SAMN05660420_02664 [Desulfuromusa kysingii]
MSGIFLPIKLFFLGVLTLFFVMINDNLTSSQPTDYICDLQETDNK